MSVEIKSVVNKNCKQIYGDFKNMIISNGKIFIDGKPASELNTINVHDKVINISIKGNLETLEVDCCTKIRVEGDVSRVKTNSGNVEVEGDVGGEVKVNCGNIHCGNVSGDCHINFGSVYRK